MPTPQALAQRSDHLALIAAFNAWTAARAAGGRGAGADFARQHFLSEQVRTYPWFDFLGEGVCCWHLHTPEHCSMCVRPQWTAANTRSTSCVFAPSQPV